MGYATIPVNFRILYRLYCTTDSDTKMPPLPLLSVFTRLFRRSSGTDRASGGIGVAVDSGGTALVRLGGRPKSTCCHDDDDPASGSHVLTRLVTDAGLRRAGCTMVLPRSEYRLVITTAPAVPEEEMAEAVRWRIQDLVDFPVDDALLDVFPMGDGNRRGGEELIYSVVAPREAVQQRINQARHAGLRVHTVDIPELALRNVAARLPEAPEGIMLVHALPTYIAVLLVRGERLFVARGLQPDTSMGPELALENLLLEMQRALDYQASHFSHAPMRHLTVLGDETLDPSALDYLGQSLRLSTRFVELEEIVPGLQGSTARCAVALGAALGG